MCPWRIKLKQLIKILMAQASKANQPDKSSKQVTEEQGTVTELLPNATFKVKLDNGNEILAHLSGRMRLNFIRVLRGDRVVVEISHYDTSKGRIIKRT